MTNPNKMTFSDLKRLTGKYPLVTLDFMLKSELEQNIENNQEIHEINKKLFTLDDSIKELLQAINKTDNM
jgi:hypothetical protein